MGDIRKTVIIRGFDEQSADIYMYSWAKATIKQYNVYLKHWTEFYILFKVHPRSPKLIEVLKFLTWFSKEKKISYSAVNSARSALYLCKKRFGVFTVGSHPEVTRHIKGIHRTNLPKVKLRITWEVNTVCRMLKQWEPLEDLSFKKLKFKTLMLALVTAQIEHLEQGVQSEDSSLQRIPQELKKQLTSKRATAIYLPTRCTI